MSWLLDTEIIKSKATRQIVSCKANCDPSYVNLHLLNVYNTAHIVQGHAAEGNANGKVKNFSSPSDPFDNNGFFFHSAAKVFKRTLKRRLFNQLRHDFQCLAFFSPHSKNATAPIAAAAIFSCNSLHHNVDRCLGWTIERPARSRQMRRCHRRCCRRCRRRRCRRWRLKKDQPKFQRFFDWKLEMEE